jgi:hypothetical protein
MSSDIRLYHRTNFADSILAVGFRDSTDHYMTADLHTGVWFSDVPLDDNEGADGDTLLAIELPEDAVAPYEWLEEGKPYREFLIPAELANSAGTPVIVNEDEL